MEMMGTPRISWRDMVEFCIPAICHSWCFPVPLHEPFLLSAQGLPQQSCREVLCSPSNFGTGCSPILTPQAFHCAGISEKMGKGG